MGEIQDKFLSPGQIDSLKNKSGEEGEKELEEILKTMSQDDDGKKAIQEIKKATTNLDEKKQEEIKETVEKVKENSKDLSQEILKGYSKRNYLGLDGNGAKEFLSQRHKGDLDAMIARLRRLNNEGLNNILDAIGSWWRSGINLSSAMTILKNKEGKIGNSKDDWEKEGYIPDGSFGIGELENLNILKRLYNENPSIKEAINSIVDLQNQHISIANVENTRLLLEKLGPDKVWEILFDYDSDGNVALKSDKNTIGDEHSLDLPAIHEHVLNLEKKGKQEQLFKSVSEIMGVDVKNRQLLFYVLSQKPELKYKFLNELHKLGISGWIKCIKKTQAIYNDNPNNQKHIDKDNSKYKNFNIDVGKGGKMMSCKRKHEGKGHRFELELKAAIDQIKESRIKITLQRFLDVAKTYGAYIGYEGGKDISKFSLAGVIKVEGGKIKVSAAFLKKFMEFDFAKFNKQFKEEVGQTSFGIDFIKDLENGTFQEAYLSLVRHQTGNEIFGILGNKITDNSLAYKWVEVYGGARGATVTEVTGSVAIKISDTFKLTSQAGFQQIDYNSIGNLSGTKETNTTWRVEGVYQPVDGKDQIKVNLSSSNFGATAGMRYGHMFGNGTELFVEATHTQWEGGREDNKIFVGVNVPLGGVKQAKYPNLFNEGGDKKILDWGDLVPNPSVDSEKVYVRKVTWNDGIVYINKRALSAGDTLNKNVDGTLKSLLLDNSGFNVISINAINDTSYLPYIQVIGGKLTIVDFKGLNQHMQSQGLQSGQVKILKFSVNDTSGISIYEIDLTKSVEIKAKIKKLHKVPANLASDFVNGIKSFEEVKAII